MEENVFSRITPEIQELTKLVEKNDGIDPELFIKYDVKRGLRDLKGKGVMAGLTNISDVRATKMVDGESVPCDGKLFYRGYNVEDLISGINTSNHNGFEEASYLLLFGELPNAKQLEDFNNMLLGYRSLPTSFVRDIIMKAPSHDMMNTLARSVLTLYSYDDKADDTSLSNVLRQSLQLISIFPLLAIYGFQAYNHFHDGKSLLIHHPRPDISTAENILHLLRIDSKFTPSEAKLLDIALVLHMEHGGGNNSTFTTHVVTSTLSDTYSVIAAAIGSLKGPRHGGANAKVEQMFAEIQKEIKDWKDEEEISAYLKKILHKEAFDRLGLIYGVGHAVYSTSDPRAEIFRSYVGELSVEKGCKELFDLYTLVEKLGPKVIADERKMYKGVSSNVDFYSGLAYSMLGLPMELFAPLFAIARISGWCAHRLEELANSSKMIRPAYKAVCTEKTYVNMADRK
jgi:citrate synthase